MTNITPYLVGVYFAVILLPSSSRMITPLMVGIFAGLIVGEYIRCTISSYASVTSEKRCMSVEVVLADIGITS